MASYGMHFSVLAYWTGATSTVAAKIAGPAAASARDDASEQFELFVLATVDLADAMVPLKSQSSR